MNVAEELREHAKRVEKGWGRGGPEGPNQACVKYWTDDEGHSYILGTDASLALEAFVQNKFGEHATFWNDARPAQGGPVNRRQVAAVLRRAADRWEREQGEVA